jgi:hypothetical protein
MKSRRIKKQKQNINRHYYRPLKYQLIPSRVKNVIEQQTNIQTFTMNFILQNAILVGCLTRQPHVFHVSFEINILSVGSMRQ